VDGLEAHQLGAVVDEIDAGEGSAHQRSDAIERELVDVVRVLRGEKRLGDLADRDELAESGVGVVQAERANPLGPLRPLDHSWSHGHAN
jgi:hypothetical protein